MPHPPFAIQIWYFAMAAAFVFGLVFGSFMNVVIYRLPQGRSIVSPRSACPQCGHLVRGYDNIPVLSWFLLGGKCRDCKAPIAARYWVIELLTGILFTGVVWHFGVSLETAKFLVFTFLLLALIFIDADVHLLPDKLTLPGTALGLLCSPLIPLDGFVVLLLMILNVRLPALGWRWYSLADSLAGAAAGAGLLFLVGEAYFRLRGREGMGFGDVKLMAMVGSFLGLRFTLMTIFFATLAGSVFGVVLLLLIWRKRKIRWSHRAVDADTARRRARESAMIAYANFQIPFGVFLGSAALLMMLFGDTILRYYWMRAL